MQGASLPHAGSLSPSEPFMVVGTKQICTITKREVGIRPGGCSERRRIRKKQREGKKKEDNQEEEASNLDGYVGNRESKGKTL